MSDSDASSRSEMEVDSAEHSEVEDQPEAAEPLKALDPLFDQSTEVPEVEKRFGTEYWLSKLDETLLARWESASAEGKNLHVPAPNNFIANDFTLLEDVLEKEKLLELPAASVEGFPLINTRLLPTPRLLSCDTQGSFAYVDSGREMLSGSHHALAWL